MPAPWKVYLVIAVVALLILIVVLLLLPTGPAGQSTLLRAMSWQADAHSLSM